MHPPMNLTAGICLHALSMDVSRAQMSVGSWSTAVATLHAIASVATGRPAPSVPSSRLSQCRFLSASRRRCWR
eukprot:7376526-Prymnesium_polylepis.1